MPNDVYNGFVRRYKGETLYGEQSARPGVEQYWVAGAWLNTDDRLGVLALGGGELILHRSAEAQIGIRAGAGSAGRLLAGGLLYADEICLGAACTTAADYAGGTTLFDLAFAVRTRLTAEETRAWCDVARAAPPTWEADPGIRVARVPGADGNTYLTAVKFGDAPAAMRVRASHAASPLDPETTPAQETKWGWLLHINPGEIQLWRS